MNLSPDTRILIVGASGLLGANLARALAQRGLRARCLVRPTSDRTKLAPHVADADIVTGDVLDPASIEPHFRGVDVCFHLSGTVDMGRPRAEVDRLIAGGGRTVLEHCRRHGVAKVVAVSTGETIGVCRRPDDACDETRPFDPRNEALYFGGPYHRLEQAIAEHVQGGLDVSIVNLLYVIDASDKTGLFRKILGGKRAPTIAGGISLSWIDDITAAMIAAAERGRAGERYMLAGENATWQDIFERVRRRGGRPGGVVRVPTAVARMVEWLHLGPPALREMLAYAGVFLYYDCAKAQRELGYRVTPLDQIIEQVFAAGEPGGAVARAPVAERAGRAGRR
jgi:dihydroflavonol-4-reductase